MSSPTPAARYVPDASVGAKLFVAEEHWVEARAFFSRLESEPEAVFCVPELFYTEVANVLWKYVRRDGMSASDAADSLRRLRHLAMERVGLDTILDDAFGLAIKLGITVYDASYLAVARVANAQIVTADVPLFEAAGQEGIPALRLRDAVPSPLG